MGLRVFRAVVLSLVVVTCAAAVAIPSAAWGVPAVKAAGLGILTAVAVALGFLFALVDYALDEAESRRRRYLPPE
jgi:hypothetical protein